MSPDTQDLPDTRSAERDCCPIKYKLLHIMNPWAPQSRRPAVAAFRKARVCHMVGNTFVWEPEQPDGAAFVPTGTRYIPASR